MMKPFLIAIGMNVLLMVTAPPDAAAQTPITQCGTISASGNYYIPSVGPNPRSTGGDCLVITAPNVSIGSGGPASIIGSGSGVGIHVTPAATNFRLTLMEGGISNFDFGIELESTGGYVSGNYDEPLQISNVSTAILIHNGSYNTVGYFDARAIWNGVWILGGGHNQVTGTYQPNSSGYSPGYAQIRSQSDGIRIDNSIANLVSHYKVSGSEVGIHLVNGAQYNAVAVNLVENSSIGISIKGDADGNFVAGNWLYLPTVSRSSTNGLDLQDNNINCGNDTWFNDVFLTASPASCIH
jgi:hypothetical protein